jgi:competence protein ComEC
MATWTGEAPSTGFETLQTASRLRVCNLFEWIERLLERERVQLPLWLPVLLGAGIAAWFTVPIREGWIAIIVFGLALAFCGFTLGLKRRVGSALVWSRTLARLCVGMVQSDISGGAPPDKTRDSGGRRHPGVD